MNEDQKRQVLEQLSSANNVLITVNSNPTVDELAAAIGLSLVLNKVDKHATTVFSGIVPSTIEFLQPDKTIETTTDSLRDFIIALDKSKADKLRYKVEDDVVRIFITPYRTSISEKDLDFSQGDFNVDVVIALGVMRREDLDKAITAHGRILHDAVVISISNKENASELGSIHWQSPQASSLCEMTVSLVNDMQPGVIDGQMATAFLTGVVAETNRFKNEKTTPEALSLSSQLMAAGANQQLIAEKLEEPSPPPLPVHTALPEEEPINVATDDGELDIDHNEETQDIHIDEHGNLGNTLEDDVALPPVSDMEQPRELPPLFGAQQQPVAEPESVETEFEEESDQPASQTEITIDEQEYVMPPLPAEAPPTTVDETDEPQHEAVTNPVDQDQEQPPDEAAGTMQHRRIIQPLDNIHSSGDKPFDLQAALMAEAADEAPVENPMPEAIVEDQSVPPLPVNSGQSVPMDTPDPAQTFSAVPPVVDEPVVDDQTLQDLEVAVDSSHIATEPPTSEPSEVSPAEAIDALRDSVAKAADAVPPQFPQPKEDLGAAPLGMSEIAPLVEQAPMPAPQVVDPNAPPPVPPPMMPQFFDADGKKDNPLQ